MLRRGAWLRRQPTGRPVPALVAAIGLATGAAVAVPHPAAGTQLRRAGSSIARSAGLSAATPAVVCAGRGPLATGVPWDQMCPWPRPASARGPGRCRPC
jgi:hypothetical protein